MRSASERQLSGRISSEIETVWIRKARGIAVRGGQQQDDPIVFGDADVADLNVRDRSPEHGVRWSGEPEQLVDSTRREAAIRANLGERVSILQQGEPRRAEET